MEKNQFQSQLLKALGHPLRLKVVKKLLKGEQCVCELAPALDCEQSNLSKHLGVLKKAGILVSKKDGLKVIYMIKHKEILSLLQIIDNIQEKEIKALQRLFYEEE
ncbi:metalloregulator ArsR/SmtB family transcription factor [Proteinivorax tanatarense]|uniref:Metalloregulator ArsR/SmtB family transcription factor n=1 Tax=Proteinivorax tanatarense TaxID=1260629 RepID=A0AAU7VIE1_9FIRM